MLHLKNSLLYLQPLHVCAHARWQDELQRLYSFPLSILSTQAGDDKEEGPGPVQTHATLFSKVHSSRVHHM